MGTQAYHLLAVLSLVASSLVFEGNAFSSSSAWISKAFHPPLSTNPVCGPLFASSESEENADENDSTEKSKSEQEEAADRWKQQAKELREQIQKMEADLPDKPIDPAREEALRVAQEAAQAAAASRHEPTSLLDGKNILLVGANGRLGSMVCRRLLRAYPEIANVVAMVHVVGENSETSRGYGRLAYEVGAEDGRGSIGPAWSAEERTATFEFDEEYMVDYHLEKLRIVECEVRITLRKKNYHAWCGIAVDVEIWRVS